MLEVPKSLRSKVREVAFTVGPKCVPETPTEGIITRNRSCAIRPLRGV